MADAIYLMLRFVAFVFTVAWFAFPICFGGWMVLFNRRFSVSALEHRKAMWKIGYTEFDIKLMRIAAVAVGGMFAIYGLVSGAQRVLG